MHRLVLALSARECGLRRSSDASRFASAGGYGWGIHLTPYGCLYNVSGFDAVAITLRDGRKFALGTDDPHGLVDAIRRNISTHV
jgi:hypothetical protein